MIEALTLRGLSDTDPYTVTIVPQNGKSENRKSETEDGSLAMIMLEALTLMGL